MESMGIRPKKSRRIVDALPKIELFRELSKYHIKALSRICHIRRYTDGEIVFKHGSPGWGLFIVLTGAVDIIVKKRAVMRYDAFEYFGEFSLVENHRRSASAKASSDTTLCYIHRAELLRLFLAHPALAIQVYGKTLQFVVEKLEEVQSDRPA